MASETYEIFAHDATTGGYGIKSFFSQCRVKSIEGTLISRTTHEKHRNKMISDQDRGNPFTRSYRVSFGLAAHSESTCLARPTLENSKRDRWSNGTTKKCFLFNDDVVCDLVYPTRAALR